MRTDVGSDNAPRDQVQRHAEIDLRRAFSEVVDKCTKRRDRQNRSQRCSTCLPLSRASPDDLQRDDQEASPDAKQAARQAGDAADRKEDPVARLC